MPIPSCFHYYSSVVELKVRDCDASRGSFLVQNCFDYPEFFVFPYEEIDPSMSVKTCVGDFDGDCIESVDCFW